MSKLRLLFVIVSGAILLAFAPNTNNHFNGTAGDEPSEDRSIYISNDSIISSHSMMITMTCPPNLPFVCDESIFPPFSSFADYSSFGGLAISTDPLCPIDPTSFSLLSQIEDNSTICRSIIRTYIISDFCGNTATCEHALELDDSDPPVLTAPTPVFEDCEASDPPFANITEFFTAGGLAVDVCLDLTNFQFVGEVQSGGCTNVITRTYAVFDICGNSATVDHIITVSDNTPPQINISDFSDQCGDDPFISDPPLTLEDFVAAGGNVTDNCALDDASFGVLSEVSSSSGCTTTIQRTYVISDICGNTGTHIQTLTIASPPFA